MLFFPGRSDLVVGVVGVFQNLRCAVQSASEDPQQRVFELLTGAAYQGDLERVKDRCC